MSVRWQQSEPSHLASKQWHIHLTLNALTIVRTQAAESDAARIPHLRAELDSVYADVTQLPGLRQALAVAESELQVGT